MATECTIPLNGGFCSKLDAAALISRNCDVGGHSNAGSPQPLRPTGRASAPECLAFDRMTSTQRAEDRGSVFLFLCGILARPERLGSETSSPLPTCLTPPRLPPRPVSW